MTNLVDSFPFRTSLRLDGILGREAGSTGPHSTPNPADGRDGLRDVLRRLAATPELSGAVALPALERHKDLVSEIARAFFPSMGAETLGCIQEPFQFANIYETPAAARLGIFREATFLATEYSPELMHRGHVMAAYEQVLAKVYGRTVAFDYPLVVSVRNPDSGLLRHFQISWDSTFVEVITHGDVPRPTSEELDRLIAEPTNLRLWMDMLPPDRFELSGFCVTRAADVTMREAISRLKDDLLEQDAMSSSARVSKIETRIRTLLGHNDLRVGLIAFGDGDDIAAMDIAFPVGRSLLLADGTAPACPIRAESTYADVFRSKEPVVISDLKGGLRCTGFEYHLMEQGIRGLLLQPLFAENRLIGLLEVGSPVPGELTAFSAFKLKEVAAPFAIALGRSLDEREDRIQSIIKRRYTAIHPSVEWRFRRAADRLLRASDDEEGPSPDEIVFDDVYPLYGLTDIRGSSDTRNGSIQDDLTEQLRKAMNVVKSSIPGSELPVLDQMSFRLAGFLTSIEGGLHSENESAALSFLQGEFEPLLNNLAGLSDTAAERVADYRSALDPGLGVLYRRRRSFEESVARFNETVSATIDREQTAAQSVFPHFFEKFHTDGVDYNIYVGESLAEKGGFSPLYLQNLRLWQLQLVSRIEWELGRLRPDLETDLPPTHLVLVQDQPLSIRFRTAERRFDVDGAYNIRYELVKKRIDKARIRGGSERLTQPGALAVVYAHGHEGREYRRYLEFLIATGYYTGEIEEYELEDMQGVSGLRAFRVAIAEEPASAGMEREARALIREVEEAAVRP